MNTDCPFCLNANNNKAFLKNDHFAAIYNIAPILPGHALVIPIRHIESVFNLNDKELSELGDFMKQTTRILLKAFNGEGFDWSLQEAESAGQSIHHVHFHIVIRKTNDLESSGKWYPLVSQNDQILLDSTQRTRLSKEELLKITEYLAKIAMDGSEK
jgi:bis(5'-adenosyl)-triphosphatase